MPTASTDWGCKVSKATPGSYGHDEIVVLRATCEHELVAALGIELAAPVACIWRGCARDVRIERRRERIHRPSEVADRVGLGEEQEPAVSIGEICRQDTARLEGEGRDRGDGVQQVFRR